MIKKIKFTTPKRQKNQFKPASRKLQIITAVVTFCFSVMMISIFGFLIFLGIISRELPNPNILLERSYELSTKIYDRNGVPIYEVFGEKNRTLVPIDQISEHAQHATMAVEDADFYAHQGFSLRGILRGLKNTITGQGLQGGSTLTQQVIKNTLLTQERTLLRKVKELILSLQLENTYTKDQILQMYLNESPYGGQNYGVYTAAKTYFNKEPKDLTLSESAYLAGLPQRPSYYSQYGVNPEAGIERRNTVLGLMYEKGWTGKDGKRYFISKDDYEAAINETLNFQAASIPFKAPHFIFYVKQYLIDTFGEDVVEQGGLQVKTTLDLSVQEKAQEIVYNEVEKSKNLNVHNGALVALDPKTGHILAMVGSKGYFLDSEPANCVSGTTGEGSCVFEGQLNVTLAKRQPGSTIKPITYATMLEQGYPASFPFLDVPTKFPGSAVDKPYIPVNYDSVFRGPMSLRKSLGNSLNIPAVKALGIVGIDSMIETAEKLGISTFKDRQRYGLALTLGGGETKLLEMAGAFGAFANKGKFYAPDPLLEVKDSQGNVLYRWTDDGGNQAISEETAFLVSDILSDDGARSEVFGFGSLLNVKGYQVAVKTGTTDDKRDNYAIGYTPSVVVAVWVGNNNNDRLNPYVASGVTGATPIWHNFMTYYLDTYFKTKPEKFEPPKTVEKIEIDALTGMLPYKDKPRRKEWFTKSNIPTSVSDWYQRLEICEEDGLLANASCKDSGDTDINNYIDINAELPIWQPYVDKWISENYSGKDEYFPPTTVTCLEFENGKVKDSNKVCVDILNYDNGAKVPLDFRLGAEVSTANGVSRVTIYMDGNKIAEDSSKPYGYNFELSAKDLGRHEFQIVATDKKGNKGSDKIELDIVGYQLE